jgi:hypothetical protein
MGSNSWLVVDGHGHVDKHRRGGFVTCHNFISSSSSITRAGARLCLYIVIIGLASGMYFVDSQPVATFVVAHHCRATYMT